MQKFHKGADIKSIVQLENISIAALSNLYVIVYNNIGQRMKNMSLNTEDGFFSDDLINTDDTTIEIKIHRDETSSYSYGEYKYQIRVSHADAGYEGSVRLESDTIDGFEIVYDNEETDLVETPLIFYGVDVTSGADIVSSINTELGSSGWQSEGTVKSVNNQPPDGNGDVTLDPDNLDDSSSSHKFTDQVSIDKLGTVEDNAKDDQTGAEIVTAIDTELGSSDWQAGGSAVENPNIFIPENVSDFTSPDIANANKIWEIQKIFTIGADADLSALEGVTLKGAGGKIILNGFTLTGNGLKLKPINEEILIDTFTGTLAGTWEPPYDLYATNFGAIPDGTVTTDNYNAIFQFLFVRNQKSGKYIFPEGHYYTSVVLKEPLDREDPTGFVFGLGVNDIEIDMKGAIVQVIPNELDNYSLFTIYKTNRYSWKGGVLIGDFLTRATPTERCQGLTIATGAFNGKIEVTDISNFSGDGIYGKGDGQFGNFILGSAAPGYPGVAEFIQGNIDEFGVIDINNSNYAYTNNTLTLSDQNFIDCKNLLGYKHVALTGTSFAGWGGLLSPRLWLAYYDNTQTFIEKSPLLDFYEDVRLKDEYDYARVVIEMPNDLTLIEVQLRSRLIPFSLTLSNVNCHHNGRQGASNLPTKTSWHDSDIYGNGGLLPGGGIDVEDERRSARHFHFDNLKLWDNQGGDIILIGAEHVTIANCKLLRNNFESKLGGLSVRYGRDINVSNCVVLGKPVSVDRNCKIHDNKLIDVHFKYSANSNEITHNDFHNSKVEFDAFSVANRIVSFIQDNTFSYDKLPTDFAISDRGLGAYWLNNTIVINDISRLSNLASLADAKIDLTGYDFFDELANVNSAEYGGSCKGLRIMGAYTYQPIASDYSALFSLRVSDYKDIKIDGSIDFREGEPKDVLIENVHINGWIGFSLKTFSDTLSNPPLIKMVNSTFTVAPEHYNWTNTGSFVLDTDDKNVSLEFDNVEFISKCTGSITATSNKLVRLKHLGATLFRDCYFETPDGKPFDLTNASIFPASLGVVTFIDCEFKNVTPTLRSTDFMLFTKSSPNMPIYADNTAALADGYPTGYMYRTLNGLLNMVY